MRKLILTLLLVASASMFAQERAEARPNNSRIQEYTPEQRIELQTKRMTTDLGLNEKQAKQIQALLLDENKMKEAQRADMKAKRASGVKLTPEEREAFRAKMQDAKKNMDEKMKSILTPEQFAKWQEKRELRRSEIIENRPQAVEKIKQ